MQAAVSEDFFSGLFGFRSLQRENYELRTAGRELNEQLTQAELDEQTLNQLRELAQSLNYASYDDSYEKVTADVIATDGSNIFNIFTINAGSDDGITAGSVVVNEDGLIGKVTTVGKDWSKVLSIVDANDSVSFTSSARSGGGRCPFPATEREVCPAIFSMRKNPSTAAIS